VTAVSLFQDAWDSLQRNRGTVMAYLALTFAVRLAHALTGWVLLPEDPKLAPDWLPLYRIVSILSVCVLSSALAAVFFARIGREIDRPLWKCADDKEAVRRFFSTWFILALAGNTLQSSAGHFHEAGLDTASAWCFVGFMTVFIMTIPAGACIMYGGGLQWPVIHERLKPMIALFPLTLNALSVALLEFVALVGSEFLLELIREQVLFMPIRDVALTALKCYTFALMWRICMLHRDMPPGESNDFEF